MKSFGRFVIHVLLPTALGAGIYLGWRSNDLLVFRWIDAVGLSDWIYRPQGTLPEVVLYSLPDGCWVYATTSWMLIIWGRVVAWVYVGLILAVGAEVGQWAGFVPGTYDSLDMLFYIGGFALARVLNA